MTSGGACDRGGDRRAGEHDRQRSRGLPAADAPPRRILCVSPRYAPAFGTFDHAFPLVGASAFMPPLGLLVVAASLPDGWDTRFVDENHRAVTDDELRWADAVLLSGMHVQRDEILRLARRAHGWDTLTVLGGPSVSGCPEWYPEVDVLHVGELGDATDQVVRRLAADVSRPPKQERYETGRRRELTEFPAPAYELVDLDSYFIGAIQFSSGCPYRCEFCDIPELYGRRARLKRPTQVVAELDAMLGRGRPPTVYFVDDNFIGDPRAAEELLRELVVWQRARRFPVRFACEATINLARRTDLLKLMKEAAFTTVFCGIESPDPAALRAMKKQQNLASPLLEAVDTFNRYGLEVVSGIILGLDTDDDGTYERVCAFIDASAIPVLTINVLHALPRTPLWRRLEQEGRLHHDAGGRASNVEFLLPYDTVVGGWRDCIRHAYRPAAILARFRHQMRHTYPNRLRVQRRPEPRELRRGLGTVARVLWHVGVRGGYRADFWRFVRQSLGDSDLEGLMQAAIVSHHMITFAREHHGEAAFYHHRVADPSVASLSPG